MSKMGSVEFIDGLVKMIALRQGFGDVLARGLARAAAALGGQATSCSSTRTRTNQGSI